MGNARPSCVVDAVRTRAAYHLGMLLPGPAMLAIALGLGLIVLLPARRLQLAGLSSRVIGGYAAALWVLAFLLAVRPLMLRFLLPILVIAYVAPFVVAPGRVAQAIARAQGRTGSPRPRGPGAGSGRDIADDPPRPPIKNVTPPDASTEDE
jgi:hypothetical protein